MTFGSSRDKVGASRNLSDVIKIQSWIDLDMTQQSHTWVPNPQISDPTISSGVPSRLPLNTIITTQALTFIGVKTNEILEVKSDENVEPDSTSDQPSSKPQTNESKPEPEDEHNVQPDSTTTDKMITNGEISGR